MLPDPQARYSAWPSSGALFASVEDLYVRPEARRQGVGTALLEAANERCAERQISYVEVQVEEEAAASFYVSLGYEPEDSVWVLARSLPIDNQGEKAKS